MKIGISSTGMDLNAEVDSRFGRCSFFIIMDLDTMNVESVSNESSNASGGAGIQAAQTMINAGVEAVLTGNIGPNAFQTLSAAGIRIFTDVSGTIRDVVEKYKRGKFKVTKSPSVTEHHGIKAVGRGFGRGGKI